MAAAPSSLVTQIREELSCSICLELFTRPKMLPCGHIFCQNCLQDHAGRGGTFQCPNCRRQVRLPPQGVTGLPDNYIVANMCEKVWKKEIAPAARGTGHHLGNQRQGEHHPEKVTFGEKGSGPGQFMGPVGVTVSDEGEIFVVDWFKQTIEVFTQQGTFVRQFPTVVSGGQKMRPTGVAVDGEGNLWVVGGKDSAEFAVQYNKQGSVLRKFDLKKSLCCKGIAVDIRRNCILITQTTGDRNWHGEIQVFRPDGTLVRTLGQQQGMVHPWYITVDGEGNILVADTENRYVYVYEDGQFKFQFSSAERDEGHLVMSWSRGICTDRAGNIILADFGNHRVEMFDKTGKFLKHVTTTQATADDDDDDITTDMEFPVAVAMTTQGQLVVLDSKNHTVSIRAVYRYSVPILYRKN